MSTQPPTHTRRTTFAKDIERTEVIGAIYTVALDSIISNDDTPSHLASKLIASKKAVADITQRLMALAPNHGHKVKLLITDDRAMDLLWLLDELSDVENIPAIIEWVIEGKAPTSSAK